MKNTIFSFIVFLCFFQSICAQKINGKVIDSISLIPIPNVAIQINKDVGDFSDEDGLFSLEINESTQITFSCLGYTTKTISLEDLKNANFIVKLTETYQNLVEVNLNLKKLGLDSLLYKINKNLTTNYKNEPIKQTVFFRRSNKADFKKVDFDLDRSTLLTRENRKLANKDFDDFSRKIKTSKSTFYTDYNAIYYSKNIFIENLKKSHILSKIDSAKGYRITTDQEDFTLEQVQEKAQNLVLKYLDKSKTYKVKSGFFKVEDTISIGKMNDDLNESKGTFNNGALKRDISRTKSEFGFLNADNFNNFLDQNYYKHKLKGITFIDDVMLFIIYFSPRKSKAKYSGNLFVNATDFAITRIDYEYADGKRGEHLNLKLLLGVKFSENEKKGTIIYKKDSTNVYRILYAKEKQGRYFYVNRSFKFVEHSSEKNKIKFGVQLEGNFYSTTELVVLKTTQITDEIFKTKDKFKKIPFLSIIEYNTSNWKNGIHLKPFENIDK